MTADPIDVLVIGGGPGGYVAAQECAGRGLRTTLVEAAHVGGTCLNVGCIPSKALIHAADRYAELSDRMLATMGLRCHGRSVDLATTIAWKDGIVDRLRRGVSSLLTSGDVRVVTGSATMVDGKTVTVATADGTVTLAARNLVLATGSRPVELDHLPFGGRVISSTDALALSDVPSSLVVVGAGYIGLELGTAFAKLGARVIIVEATDAILPQYPCALTKPVARRLEHLGVELLLGCTARALSDDGAGLVVEDAQGARRVLDAERILVAVGRAPATRGFGLERLELTMDGAAVRIDDRCRTSMHGVYAIGDVTGEPMLAHRAMAQGVLVADVIAGGRRRWDHRAMPAVCFTDPEIMSVGLSADEATSAGLTPVVASVPFRANGRALTLGAEDGFVQIVARVGDQVVVGVHGVGIGVSELAAPASLAIEMGATLDDISLTVHAHPTLGEVLHEAAQRGLQAGAKVLAPASGVRLYA